MIKLKFILTEVEDLYKNLQSWLDVYGRFHPVEHNHHDDVVRHLRSMGLGGNSINDLWKTGWQRITFGSSDKHNCRVIYCNNGFVAPIQKQKKTLVDLAIETNSKVIVYDNDEDDKIIWASNDLL